MTKAEKKRRQKKEKHFDELPSPVAPKTEAQRDYIEAIDDSQLVFGIGPAGTGKTYVAACKAADAFMRCAVSRIILTRPNVPAGRSLGFFPGTLEEKIAPWVQPFTEVLKERMGSNKFEHAQRKGDIEVVPFGVMRGRTLDDAFVILDEGQNTDRREMQMFLTRIGDNAKVVVNGDLEQSDVGENNGLDHAIGLADKHDLPTPIIEFRVEDIVRSGLVAQWLRAYDEDGA